MTNYKEDFWKNELIDFLNDRDDLPDEDAFQDAVFQEIDNMVIYYHQAKEICSDLDYDVFQDHELWGRAENWTQAAYAALYDMFTEGDYRYEDYLNYQNGN